MTAWRSCLTGQVRSAKSRIARFCIRGTAGKIGANYLFLTATAL